MFKDSRAEILGWFCRGSTSFPGLSCEDEVVFFWLFLFADSPKILKLHIIKRNKRFTRDGLGAY
jgi:hypothetical protein